MFSCSSGAKDEAEHYGFSQELYASAGDHERGSLLEDEGDEEDYYYEQLEEYETRQGFSVRRDHADAHNKIFGTVWCVHVSINFDIQIYHRYEASGSLNVSNWKS